MLQDLSLQLCRASEPRAGYTNRVCEAVLRSTCRILRHVVGERTIEIAQVAEVLGAGMRISDLLRIPLSFPTYAGALGESGTKGGNGARQGVCTLHSTKFSQIPYLLVLGAGRLLPRRALA